MEENYKVRVISYISARLGCINFMFSWIIVIKACLGNYFLNFLVFFYF